MRDNPWLAIPWQDYEGHMSCPEVAQLQLLGELFRQSLARYRPDSVAILGCATGNDLQHIDPTVTRSVLGVDINPAYLAVAYRRFDDEIPGLSLVCCDREEFEFRDDSFALIFGGLILEYVEPRALIRKATAWLSPGGVLAVVVQLPSASAGKVSRTRYSSLTRLDPAMQLVDPATVHRAADASGLVVADAEVHRSTPGKPFHVAHLVKQHDRLNAGHHS